ncbi:MAG: DUF4271 domain-containing protein [Fulvivirga sp.]
MGKSAKYIVLFILSLYGHCLSAQTDADTLMVQNLMSEAYFFDEASEAYLPLIDSRQFKGSAIHFELDRDQQNGLLLIISTEKKFSLFIDKKLVQRVDPTTDLIWNTEEIFNKYGKEIEVTFYSPTLDAENINASLFSIVEATEGQLSESEVIILQQRGDVSSFQNFLIIGLLTLGLFGATLYNYYPRVAADFFRFERAVAIREIDENLLKSRPFNRINVLFYLLFSLTTGLLLVTIFYLARFSISIKIDTTVSLIWLWLQATAIIFLWLILKYLVVINFTNLFNIKAFLPSHYFNYIRLGFFSFLAILCIVVVSYLGFEITISGYYTTLFTILLILVALRSLLIMFKLMNSASYKFLHLFSYLCGTEIIPLGIILFLGFNQPF